MADRKKTFGQGGLSDVGSLSSAYFPYYNTMLLMIDWGKVETSPGVYNWTPLDADIATLVDAGINVSVGSRIQPKQFGPTWLFNSPYSVPAVSIQNSPNVYGYYFDAAGTFRQRFYRFLDKLADHCIANGNVVFIQLYEGHRKQPIAYTDLPLKTRFNISNADFLQWQKDAWQHAYDYTKTTDVNGDIVEEVEIVLNAATNDSALVDYILSNLPYAWIRAGISEGSDYGYNLELYDWDSIDAEITAKTSNSGALRKRCDLAGTPTRTWFIQSYNKNMMQVALHMLTKANDIWTFNDNSFIRDSTFSIITNLVNDLSGNDLPTRQAAVAWWAPNGKIDGADITRFPSATFGKVLNNGNNTSTNPNDYVTKANVTRLTAIRNSMGNGCTLISAQFGTGADPDRTNDDKYLSDIGMKVRQEPLGRWLTQPNWINESKMYYRLGIASDYWGRYAVGFKDTATKIYFKLDDDFKIALGAITVTIVYWNESNCQWRLRNITGTNALTKTNTGTKTFQTISVDIDSFQSGQLSGGNDLSLEFVSGNNTVKFAFLKVNKNSQIQIMNNPPVVDAGPNVQQTGTSVNLTGATATDPDAGDSIANTLWSWQLDQDGNPVYPVGATPVINSPTSLTGASVSNMTVNGQYVLDLAATDTRGSTSHDSRIITKVTAVVGPTANAGADKTITQPANTTTIGGTDTPGSFPIASISYLTTQKPDGATNPTFATPNAATTVVNGLTTEGLYVIQKTVSDNQVPANTDPDLVNITVNPATAVPLKWGALMLGTELSTDQKIAFSDNLNVDIIRTSVPLSQYTGASGEIFLNKIMNTPGKKVALVVNWTQSGSGPRDFVDSSNLNTFLNRLDNLLSVFHPIIEVLTFENEPDNSNYYNQDSTNTTNYITEIQQGIVVCHNHNIKCSDGCIHVQNATTNSGRIGAIKTAYQNEWADLDYINIHGYSPRDSNVAWTNAINAMKNARKSTQKIISNECGIKNQTDPDTIIPAEATAIVNIIKDMQLAYAIITASGAGGIAKPLNVVGTVNRNGNGDNFIAAI